MKRSVGVTVIAILSLLGSVFTLLMGIIMAFAMAFAPRVSPKEFPASPAFFKMMLFMGILMYVAPAIWGICTSIGLFRLKIWARLSIIVFSVLLVLMFGFGGLISLLVPFPSAPDQPIDGSVVAGVRIFMGVFSAALVALGIWWIVFFTRAGVVQQFIPASPVPDAMQAPLSPAALRVRPAAR